MWDDDTIADPKFINNISEADLKSLEDGQWVTDNVLTLALNMMQQNIDKRQKNGEMHKITFVDPSVTLMLKKNNKRKYQQGNYKKS